MVGSDVRGVAARGRRRAAAWVRCLAVVACAMGGTLAGIGGAAARQAPTLPILIYHHIEPVPAEYAVTPEQLEAQLAWLVGAGYTTITPSDLLAALDGAAPLPPNPVMLTVDDGWASQHLFVEAAARHGVRAAWFLPNYAAFSPDQIRALHAAGEVCGHTVNHADLALLPYAEQVREVVDNKVWLEGIVGAPITCFAYPFGSYTDETVRVVADAGYRIAFLAWNGPAPLDGSLDPLRVGRINVDGSYTVERLAEVMRGGW